MKTFTRTSIRIPTEPHRAAIAVVLHFFACYMRKEISILTARDRVFSSLNRVGQVAGEIAGYMQSVEDTSEIIPRPNYRPDLDSLTDNKTALILREISFACLYYPGFVIHCAKAEIDALTRHRETTASEMTNLRTILKTLPDVYPAAGQPDANTINSLLTSPIRQQLTTAGIILNHIAKHPTPGQQIELF